MVELVEIGSRRVALGPGGRAVWHGLSRSWPEPVNIGTLALLMWPQERPAGWRPALESQISRLRQRLVATGIGISSVPPHRYQLVRVGGDGEGLAVACPVAGSDPPRQPAKFGERDQRGGEQQHRIPERRFSAAAGHQSIGSLHGGSHALQHEEIR